MKRSIKCAMAVILTLTLLAALAACKKADAPPPEQTVEAPEPSVTPPEPPEETPESPEVPEKPRISDMTAEECLAVIMDMGVVIPYQYYGMSDEELAQFVKQYVDLAEADPKSPVGQSFSYTVTHDFMNELGRAVFRYHGWDAQIYDVPKTDTFVPNPAPEIYNVPRLSNLTGAECLAFVRDVGLEVPTDVKYWTEEGLGNWVQTIIYSAEELPEWRHENPYEVTRGFANAIADAVAEYYAEHEDS